MHNLSWAGTETLELIQEGITADKQWAIMSAVGQTLSAEKIAYLEKCNDYQAAAELELQRRIGG